MSPFFQVFAALLSCLNLGNPISESWLRDAAVFAGQGQLTRAELVQYIQSHTPTEADNRDLPLLLERLGDEEFQTRELASRQLLRLGQAAVPVLQRGCKVEDAEVRRRCVDCLHQLEEDSAMLPVAVRLLAASSEPNAARVLLDFLPYANSRSLELEVQKALTSLPAERRPSASDVEKLLKDKNAGGRGAALAEKANKEQK